MHPMRWPQSNPSGLEPPRGSDPVEVLRHRAQVALSVGDDDAAVRLERLATAVEHEADYATNVVDRGLPIVRRRTDAPQGATIGWYFAHDAVVRAERRRIGASLPDDGSRRE
jgi:hypothetical protein